MLEIQLENDLKTSLLARDSIRVMTLRTLKSVLLNAKVATNKRQTGLTDEEVIKLFSKEAKKRQESAQLYIKGGRPEKAAAELSEKAIIEAYLPTKLSEKELTVIIEAIIVQSDCQDISAMGSIIGQVKKQTSGTAEGSLIAKLVKERLQK